MLDWSIWQPKIEEVEAFFEPYGVSGKKLVNELARIQVLSTLISTDPTAKAFGLTASQLLELAERATVGVFGAIPVAKEDFGKAYWTGLEVSPFIMQEWYSLQSDAPVQSGLWLDTYVKEFSQRVKEFAGTIVFGDVDHYLGLVEDILNDDWTGTVVLHTESDEAYQLLQSMYPLANIVMEYPREKVDANFVVSLLPTAVEGKEMTAIMRLAERFGSFVKARYTRVFFPASVQYANLKQSHFFKLLAADPVRYLSMIGETVNTSDIRSQLTSITQHFPTNLLECVWEEGTFKKVSLSMTEEVVGKILTNTMIPLPSEEIRNMEQFSLPLYVLQLHGVSLRSYGATRAFGTDLIESAEEDTKLAMYSALWELLSEVDVYVEVKEIIESLFHLPKSRDIAFEAVLRPVWKLEEAEEAAASYYEAMEEYELAKAEVENRFLARKDEIWKELYEKFYENR